VKKHSLKFKLLVGGTLCVLLPLLVFAVFSDHQLSNELKSVNQQNMVNIAKSLASLAQITLQEEIKIAKDLAVGNTTIDVATKVSEVGISEAAPDIQRLETKLVNTMEQIGANL